MDFLKVLRAEEPVLPLTEEERESVRYIEEWNRTIDRRNAEEKANKEKPPAKVRDTSNDLYESEGL